MIPFPVFHPAPATARSVSSSRSPASRSLLPPLHRASHIPHRSSFILLPSTFRLLPSAFRPRHETSQPLLALTLLALFVLAGVFYFRSYVTAKPFGIILFTGEGLVSTKLAAARIYDGGADRRLAIESLPNLALITTHAADFAVADAASAAGAWPAA